MSETPAAAWLAQETEELLTVGSVGLYELTAMLRNSELHLSDDAIFGVAKDVVTSVVASGRAQICLLRWPKDTIIDGPLSPSVLDETAAWDWLPSHLYFALMPA